VPRQRWHHSLAGALPPGTARCFGLTVPPHPSKSLLTPDVGGQVRSFCPATEQHASSPHAHADPRVGVIYTPPAHLANSEERAGRTPARQKQQALGRCEFKGVQSTTFLRRRGTPPLPLLGAASPAPSHPPAHPSLPRARSSRELGCVGTEPLRGLNRPWRRERTPAKS